MIVWKRYLTTGDYSALQQMNTDYPTETRTLIEKVLQLGTIEDSEIHHRFLHYYQDTTLQRLITDGRGRVLTILVMLTSSFVELLAD